MPNDEKPNDEKPQGGTSDGDGNPPGGAGANDGKPQGGAPESKPDGTSTSDSQFIEKLKGENADLRNSRRDLSTKFADAEKRLQERDNELLTLKSELSDMKIGSAISRVAGEFNPRSLAPVSAMIDRSKVVTDKDDAARDESIRAQVKEIIKQHPYLFLDPDLRGDAGAKSGTRGFNMNDAIRKAAGRS